MQGNPGTPDDLLCETCEKVELTETNCHDGPTAWHCGCELEAPPEPETVTLTDWLAAESRPC